MKNLLNNKRDLTLYILFAVATLLFVVLLFCQILFHVDISPLAPALAVICMLFFGGIIVQIRSGPPW